LMTIPSFEM